MHAHTVKFLPKRVVPNLCEGLLLGDPVVKVTKSGGHQNNTSKETQRERIKEEKPLCLRKTSFGQAIIRDHTHQENIPMNLLHNKKNIPNKSVREYQEMTGSEKRRDLDEIMNRKLSLNNENKSLSDLVSKESHKGKLLLLLGPLKLS